MNRILICGLAALLMLAGCKDASAKLKNGSDVIMTVGNKSFTKGEAYEMLMNSGGSDQVYTDATEYIAKQEIEVTDEMKESAQSTLDTYKNMYGEQFPDYLENMGQTEDEYLDSLILNLQKDELKKKYISDNFESICKKYNPIQTIVLSFTTEEDASKALSSLKDGNKAPSTAASENNSTSSGIMEVVTIDTTTYDSAALSVIRTASPDDGWIQVPSSDGATIYVLRVVSNTPEDFKDAAITSLSNNETLKAASEDYFFRKYNFHVYDISIYNGLKESNPDILIQDKAAPSAEPEATASAEAETEASAEPEASASPETSASPEATEAAK